MGDETAVTVGCELTYEVATATTITLQVTAHRQGPDARLTATTSAGEWVPEEVAGSWAAGGRHHLLAAPPGRTTVRYQATVTRPVPATPAPVSAWERVVALRPSRYCPSDQLGGFAAARFAGHADDADTVRAICSYVHDHTTYTAGASGPSTDATQTLLSGAGVCRDYAHLTVALCRAMDIPARVVAVYAPGLSPMDFHLVAEAAVDDRWYVWDATRLAPRSSLARIATGRDAADVAFATTVGGAVDLTGMSVLAVTEGELPVDDPEELVALH
ncbi:transglutaminase family protein [Solwaraspora sp. WMMD791]|uniref:transglutaminase-like domain-containing protein n=1 Tax=Solwaraspora sp. WMMD791 TaxID=3016086 RepID=UPI00249BD85F|nr:transglutaminase family protein [Solwaraspora sp. WMMD791]WFE29014.1 transglutaminase family protein [Solwaraspora sp. WMMD791]